MSLDPYLLCPCESGKKLKFCCSDIAAEMVKALQLHEGGQSRAARKILEKLHKEEPARAWVATSFAGVLLSMDKPAEARETLTELLKETPNHPLGRILDATAKLDLDGYDESRPAIHRAFTKGFKEHPDMVGSLAAGIANFLLEEGRYIASRQHMAFAMRFVRAEDREPILMRLLEFDNDKSIPYPLRGVHNLKPLDDLLNEKEQAVFKKALGLSSLGCWSEAATVATALTKSHPKSAELWGDIALFHAWDGNESSAAVAFHKASQFATVLENAISYETLSQLLNHELNQVNHQVCFYKSESAARLLSLLDDSPRFVRQQNNPNEEQNPEASIAQYQILNKEPSEEKLSSPIDFENIPKFIGALICIGSPDADEVCRLSVEAEFFEEAKAALESVADDFLNVANFEDKNGDDIPMNEEYDAGWQEYKTLDVVYYFDEKNYELSLTDLEKEKWSYFTESLWLDNSLSALGGKTPLEASKDSSFAVPLAAAVNVFDVFADQFNHQLDVESLKERLGIALPENYEIEDDSQLDSCEVLELLRIPVENLSNEQLKQLFNRTQLIQHSRFTEKVMGVVLQRDNVEEIVEEERMAQVFHAYIDLARDNFNLDAAFERIDLGREWAKKTEQKFEDALQWELRELQFRVVNPEDPKLTPFLENLHRQYLRKLPELEAVINNLLMMHGITPPWKQNIITADMTGASKELWNPEAGAEPEQQSKGKLWFPGEE